MIKLKFNEELFKALGQKLQELKVREKDFGAFHADLNDLVESCNDFLEQINNLLSLDAKNLEEVETTLIQLEIVMEHMRFHTRSGLPIIRKLINR